MRVCTFISLQESDVFAISFTCTHGKGAMSEMNVKDPCWSNRIDNMSYFVLPGRPIMLAVVDSIFPHSDIRQDR